MSENFLKAPRITFTFEVIPFEKLWTLLSPKICQKITHEGWYTIKQRNWFKNFQRWFITIYRKSIKKVIMDIFFIFLTMNPI